MLAKTKNGNQFMVIMDDQYFKLTITVPTWKTSATHMASIFYDNGILPYRIPTYILRDNGSKFVSSLKPYPIFYG